MTTPAWGCSPERYESATGEAAWVMGVADWPSPVVPFVGPDRRVLDLGCGTGHTARLLSEKGCTVVGVEFDERAAVSAGAWCERVLVCDLDITSVADQLGGDQFDVVVAGDILEHLRDPETLLRSMIPLLAPDGTVVASVPNIAHGSVRLALLGGRFDYAELGILDRTHLRFFTRDSIEQLFVSAGFVIEKLDRKVVDVTLGEPYDRDLLPAGIEEAVAAMPEATTYEFVLVARPAAPSHQLAPSADRAVPVAPLGAEVLRQKDRTIAGLREQIAELRVQVMSQAGDLAALRAEHDAVTNARVWRTWMKVRPATRWLLGRLAPSSSTRRSSRS